MRTKSFVSLIIFLGASIPAGQGATHLFTDRERRGATHLVTDRERLLVPEKVGILAKEGGSAYRNKQYDRAISSCTAGLQITSDNKVASVFYNLRAAAYIGKDEFEKAGDDANKAVRLDPKNPEGYSQRAQVYAHMGNFEKAISDGTTAIRLNPNFARAYFNRGASLSSKGEHERAIADYNQVIRLNPKYEGTYYNRAIAHQMLGRFDSAIADYNEAIRRKPTDALSYSGRGSTYFATGNYKATASDLKKAVQLSPSDHYVLNGVAWFKATCPDASFRNGEEAVRTATKACELTKWNNAELVDTLAAAYAEAGDFERAVKYEMLALKTNDVDANRVFPDQLDKRFRPQVGREDAQQRLKLFQRHKPYHEEPRVR